MRTLLERFEEKFVVDAESGCWLWTACRNSFGYGMFGVDGRIRRAHRVSYELYVGPIANGLFVCHDCDTPPCVNPGHLWLGTNADNVRDMAKKGRSPKGDQHHARAHPERLARGGQHGRSKLCEAQVIAIRSMVGLTQQQMADLFGVNNEQISRIRSGKSWAHLPSQTGSAP